jgi:Ca2+-binding RTX toxin-like protein
LVFDLSGSVGGLTLGIDPGHTATLTGDRTLMLSFGVDTATDSFFVASGDFVADLHLSAADLQSGLDFGGVATTVTDGTAALDATFDAHLVNPASIGGATAVSDQALTSTRPDQLFQTSLTGAASLSLDLTAAQLPQAEHVDVSWQAPFDPAGASVTYQADSALAQLVSGETPAPPQFVSLFANMTDDPPLVDEVNSALSNVRTILENVQSVINTASVLAQNLPFVGQNLKSENMLQPAIDEISNLQTKLNSDLQVTTTALSTVQSDIASVLSSANLLPDSGTTDVQLNYLLSGDTNTHHFHGEAVDLTNITTLEVELVLGHTWHSACPIGFDFGFPGLSLKVNNGSNIDGSIGWRFNFGFGLTTAGEAGPAYIVFNSDSSPPPGYGAGTLGLNLGFTLGSNFTALAEMGFLQALITEKPTGQHTGMSGSIGVALGSSSNQHALSGGAQLALADLDSITADPTFGLNVHSNLALAFGADFQKDQNGNYVDQSKFPSIDADFALDWTIASGGPNAAATTMPNIGLNNLQLDIGQAITDFILPVLKPFYDATHGLEPVFDFLTSKVPVVGDTVQWLHDNLSGAGDALVHQVLKTYDPDKTYDWLYFGVDLMIEEGVIDETAGRNIEKAAEAVFTIIHQLDAVYTNASAPGIPSLKIGLGKFGFGGKDLRLEPIHAHTVADLTQVTNAIIDISGLDQSDPAVQEALNNYIGTLNNLLPVDLKAVLGSAAQTIKDVYDTLSDVVGLANANGTGGDGTITKTMAKVSTPFFDHPQSIIGLLFGQNIDFVKIDVGYSYHYHKVTEFPVFSLYRIVDLNLIFDPTLNLDLGLSFGYDTRGLLELLNHQGSASSLLDGIFIGGDPLLPGTNTVLKLEANVFVGAGADVLGGLAGVGIEGGLGIDVSASLLAAPNQPRLHYDEFLMDDTFDLNQGLMGPVRVKAEGWAGFRLMTEELWGAARQYHHFPGLPDHVTLFHYPTIDAAESDVYPLAFYHPSTGELDLYMGPTATQRFLHTDGKYEPGHEPPPADTDPNDSTRTIERDGVTLADQLDQSSETYDITIDDGDMVTLSAYGVTQTFSGPVKYIVAITGSGNDTIHIHSNAPNDVRVNFVGSGSSSTLKNTDQGTGHSNQSAPIGGIDIFEAAGGNATLTGGSGNDLLTGGFGDDLIKGNGGNDTVYASTGNDTLDGGDGINFIDLSNIVGAFTLDLAAGTAAGQGFNYSIVNFTQVQGNQDNDTITGDGNGDLLILGEGNNTVYGGSGKDTITAGNGNNSIYGGGGDDSITVDNGFNFIDGGDDNDTITVGTGNNTIYGGAGADLITAGPTGTGSNSIDGGDGNDTIVAGIGNNRMYGGIGNDNISVGTGNNYIDAGGDNDTVLAGAGNNTIYAGTGNDRIQVGGGGNFIDSGDGNDTITAGNGGNTIYGLGGADSISVGSGDNYIDGGDDNDIISVGTGNNTIYGGAGADLITAGVAGAGNDFIDAGTGNDTVTTGNGNDRIYGGDGNDSVTAGNGANTVDGGSGNDWISTGSGADYITGDDGSDTILAGDGKNYVDGGTDNDSIVSGIGISTLIGGDGNDTIRGNSGADFIDGGTGDDFIVAGTGSGNSILGGDGKDTIYGGNGHDTIDAGADDDSVIGGQGGSLIYGRSGNNTIYGGAGADTISADDGNNSILAGGSNDSITVGQGNNYITGDAGNDTITAGSGNNTIYGGTGHDSITAGPASAGNNYIDAGDGNDTVTAGNGANTIYGGIGNDSITAGPAGAGNNFIDSGADNDTITAGSGNNTIYGGTGHDSITAGPTGAGNNSIDAGDGNDTVTAGNGANTIYGGIGNDSITAGPSGAGNNSIDGGDGNDTITVGHGANSILGGTGDDSITAGNGNNTIYGGTGNDTIFAGNGNNLIYGGDDNDSITAGNGINTVDGGNGNDWIWTGSGADYITGDDGNDTIYGGDGNNTVFGGTGDDYIVVGDGNNWVEGGDDNDTILAGTGSNILLGQAGNDSISAVGGTNLFDGGDGNDTIAGGTGDNSIFAGTGDDRITGGTGNNIIYGESGNDTIVGGTGSNLIYGGDGDDSITGGAGSNTIYGGAGHDFIKGGTGTSVLVAGDSGGSTLVAGVGNDTMIASGGIGNFFFGALGNNVVIYGSPDAGTGAVDYYNGTPQGDVISAGDGTATVYGGAGPSIIITGTGNDLIVAGDGGNFIWGGGGNDTILGGRGADIIYGGAGVDSISGGGGSDIIHARNGAIAIALSAAGQVIITGSAAVIAFNPAADTINAGSGNTQIFADGGNNLIYGGSGVSTITGGSGQDMIYGGSNAGVKITGGAGGDVIIGSDGGFDTINAGTGGDRIEVRGGHNVVNGGPGNDIIVGGTGNDTLSGGGGSNILVGGAASDVLNGGPLDRLFPNSGITGDSLSSPTTPDAIPGIGLPSDQAAQGWWSQIAGPTGIALGSNNGTPVIAADANGPYVAWTQTLDSTSGLYVAHYVGGTWTALAGSATGTGLQSALGSAANPSIAIVGGEPVVAWTSVWSNGSSIEVAAFDANTNAWGGFGNSMGPTGISGIGNVDDAKVVSTSSGPVVFWRDLSSATPHLFAARWNGSSWVEVSAGSASGQGVSGATAVASNYAVASDVTKLAAAFVQPGVHGDTIQVVEYSGGTWQALPNPDSNPQVPGFSEAPSLAYAGGKLFLAWAQRDVTTAYYPHIFVASEQGGVWTPAGSGAASGLGVSSADIVSGMPELAASGSTLRLVWAATIETPSGLDDVLRTLSWNGTAFAADRPTDISGVGIGDLRGAPQSLALTIDPAGRAWLASETPGGTGFSVRAGTTSAAHVFVADATHSIASILSGAHAGDLILVNATTADTTGLTLTASASGIAIVGLDGASFAHGITINGANGVTIRNLDVAGAVSVSGASGVSLAENTFRAHVTIDNAVNFFARDNRFLGTDQGLVIASASAGKILSNSIVGASQGLVINAAFTGSIASNDISGGGTGIIYAAVAPLSGNRIHDNQIGIVTSLASQATSLGFATGSNDIFQNVLGIQSQGAAISAQHIFNNTTGVSGSGVLGGNDMSGANLIAGNQTGVGSFTGLIEYNRIEANAVGIAATTNQFIFNNQIVLNTTAGILVSGVNKVAIAGNTMRAFVGDGVRIVDGSFNVELIDNIIWSNSGYGIYVGNDSQSGFWSDYNTLYADSTGKIVYWTKDFVDILDWQDDVARFDLHSVGSTVVNPTWAEPRFGVDADGVLTTRPVVAGQRSSDPTTSGGDPAGSFIGYRGVANVLTNGSFENGLSSWTFTTGGTTGSSPAAWDGSSVYLSGPASPTVVQQSIDLVGQGYSTATIDSGALQVAFGGRVQLQNALQSAQISLVFHSGSDSNSAQVGNTVVLAAGSDVGRWMRVFDTTYVPAGARSVQFLFQVTNSASSTGVALDNAFLGVIARGTSVDQGDRPPGQTVPLDAANGRLALRAPDLYTDWELDKPKFITWDSYGAAAGGAVRIELWKDGASGPAFLSTIIASTPDTGRYSWTPSASALSYGTYGLHIRIISVANNSVYDMSTEPFTVPENGNTYYVNDSSSAGDQYTSAAGSNRNDGKLASAPKPNPVNLFRTYDVTGDAIVYVDTGTYPLITGLQLSASTDRGLGLDTAFTIHGPTNPGTTALLTPAIPGPTLPALIDLLGTSFVSLDHLILQGGVEGLLVHGGSNSFSASYLTAIGQSGNAFDITTNSPNSVLDHLTATNAGGEGLLFSGSIQGITYFTGSNDKDGIVATGSIGTIANSTLTNNLNYGLYLQIGGGTTTIEANTISGNGIGAYLNAFNGTSFVFGNANLGLGRGNIVTGNASIGVYADGNVQVVGNALHDNTGALALRLRNGASATDNLIYANDRGIEILDGTTVQGNRIYDNTGHGIDVSGTGVTITQNVLYSNGLGVYISNAANFTFTNNLVYADQYGGVEVVNGGGLIRNNTFYEPAAGVGNSSSTTVNVAIDSNASAVTLADNIVVALAGIGIRVADAVQAGFVSNYNVFYTSGTGRIGNWLGVDRTSFAQWRTATQRDGNSLFADPKFANPAGPDGNLGYVSVASDGRDDDFHVQSLQGSFHGGSLAIVRDAATGLPVFPTATLTIDAADSPAIDRGDPALPVGAEPAPNGGIIEIGAYGGTAQASKSPTAFLKVTSPAGGDVLFQGAATTITWSTFNVSGTVDVAATTDGVNFTTIATGLTNTGQYNWTVNGNVFAAGSTYRIKVSSTTTPSTFGLSDQFAISAPVSAYYLNDSYRPGVDQYTTATGDDANSGLRSDLPMATFQALLAKYHLHAGDTVYVDNGTYSLSTNVVFTSDDSGTSDTLRLTIQGPTHQGATATIDRTNRAGGFWGFEFNGAQYVTLQNLHITGADYGVVLDDNSNSIGIALSNDMLDGNNNGVYVGIGNSGFTLSSSTLAATSLDVGKGIYIYGTDGQVVGSSFANFDIGVFLDQTTNSVVRADTFTNDTAATSTNFANNILLDQLTVSGGYYGISTFRSSGAIQNSTVHDTASFGITADGNSSVPLLATGNTIYNIGGSNASAAALTVSGAITTASNNVVYSSYDGIRVYGGVASNNRVFGMSDFGIEVDFNGSAVGNKIYDNAIGILLNGSNATVTNNTIYDNTTGIQVNRNSSGLTNFTIASNTIVQPSGTALALVEGFATPPSSYSVRDNIFTLGVTAIGLDAPASAQAGYVSDYNLYDLTGGAVAVRWSGQSFALSQVQTLLGLDAHSFAANPMYNSPAGADGIRGFVSGVDHGADDDFSLKAGSPAIDRGDPTAPYFKEPVGATFGDGSRIDIGAGGNSANAAQSPSQIVQLFGQTSSQRYQVGQGTTISFRSDGLAAQDPVLFINVGGGLVTGSQPWNVFQPDQFGSAAFFYTDANPDTSQVDAPAAVFQTLRYNPSGLSYSVPLADGAYKVTLLFADPSATYAGQRVFDIVANGATVAPNFDVYAAAGAFNKAIGYTFNATASGGSGIRIDLQPHQLEPFLSGIEITRANTPAPPTWTASLDVSVDNGATWSRVASGVALDRLGAGSFAWTPTAATAGTIGLLRVTATDGTHTVTDRSLTPFMIAPAGHNYYVNDNSTTGDVFTTAIGNDANSGKSPNAPMASLATLLSLYHLQPGDTVYIDSGTYNLSGNITLGSSIAGTAGNPITITGAGASTVLVRTDTAPGTDVFKISGAHDLRISNLAMTGGADAIDLVDSSNSTNISLSGLDISKFGSPNTSGSITFYSYGVYDGAGSLGFSLTNSNIHDATGAYNTYGVKLSDTITETRDATISGNMFKNLSYGVQGSYNNNVIIANNQLFNTTAAAISVGQSIVSGAALTVSGNTVTGGATGDGIDVSASYAGSVIVNNNTVSGMIGGTGIFVLGPVSAQNNESYGNRDGFGAGAGSTSSGNRIHDNTHAGITTYRNAGNATLIGNTIYNNPEGILVDVTRVVLINNVFYSNTQIAVDGDFTDLLTLTSNTIDQSGGTAIRFASSSSNLSLKNNIVNVSNGGSTFNVANTAETNFASDWNLFHLSGGATMGVWGGQAVGTFLDWRFGTGFDIDSTDVDPQFTDVAHGNYRLLAASSAIDRGDPASAFANEPGNNGGRINLGFEGNTAQATQSPSRLVQVLSPNGLDKLAQGQATTITWRSSGITGATSARVEASPDNGTNWELIAANASVDATGSGSLIWTPDFQTNGNTALIRVTMSGISDTSDKPFLVANGGHDYYVNDGSTAGDEVTTAVGNNLNSGKSPDKPVASLEALLSSYKLGAGDIVHVDTGTYIDLVDLTFGPNASGTGPGAEQTLTIQGPTGGGAAVFNRADTVNNASVFTLNNARYVTFANLDVTGAVNGFVISDYINGSVVHDAISVGISIVNTSIHDNANDGLYLYTYPADVNIALTIDHSKIFNNTNAGLELNWLNGATIINNEFFANSVGIYTGAINTTIAGNSVHDNRTGGIAVLDSSGPTSVYVTDNRVFNNSAATSGYGIQASGSVTLVSGNTVTGQGGTGAYGIQASFGAKVDGNIVSGNYTGIGAQDTGTTVSNNRVFANTTNGIGVTADGTSYLTAEYNLYYRGVSGSAAVAALGGTTYATLANWQAAAAGQNQHSLEGNPKFIDIDGADNVLGGADTGLGGGADDNFTPGKLSPAIDAANADLMSLFDLFGQGRHDDPAVANTGAGTAAYYDIGAIEFQGASSDATAPTFVSGTNLPAEGASTDAAFASITLRFSEAVDRSSALSASNYRLSEAGTDGVFGTQDDATIPLSPAYVSGSSDIILNLTNGALANGYYRLTVSPNNGLLDTAGNPLDGDGIGGAGGAFVRTFHIDRSHDHPPSFANSTLSTPSGAALPITLSATSPDNSTLSYGFVTQPKHGTVQNFDTVAGTFTYVPSSGFVGAETITVFAQDGRALRTQATLTINVTAVNQAPIAYPQSVAAYSGVGQTITLPQGYDLETPASQLTLVIVSQPTHGTLQITGQNTVRYTSGTTYAGSDQFSYAWRDTGSPAGTTSNGLTGAAATVSITVAPINHAPTTHDATVTTSENVPYTFTRNDFPFSDPDNNALLNVIITALPSAGTLTLNNSAVSLGATIAPADIDAGKLVFTPAPNGAGASYATFGFVVQDDGGTANGGIEFSANATMTVSVTPINNAPTTHDATVTIGVNTLYIFKVSDFPFQDANNTPANLLLNVIVTSQPGAGILTFANQAVTIGQKIAASDIAAGKLVFTPGQDEVGAIYASFRFEVEDDGGTNPGADTSPQATMTISVVPLTVAISGTAQEGQTLTANPSAAVTGYQWQALLGATWTDIGGATSATYMVQEADEGHQLRVHVTATGGGSADSDPTSAVSDITLAFTTAASITDPE